MVHFYLELLTIYIQKQRKSSIDLTLTFCYYSYCIFTQGGVRFFEPPS